MRRPFLASLLASVPLLSGCYEYVRSDSPALLVARAVELVLTDAGSAAETGALGPGIEAVDGLLVSDSAGIAVIAVRRSRSRTGEETAWQGERVAVPSQYVASLLERRFSRSRTAFAGGLAAVGLVAATVALRGSGGANGGAVTPKPIGSQ